MNRPAAAAIVLALAVLLAGCSVSVVRHGELDTRRAAKIVSGISEIRGLEFRSRVPMNVTDADGVRAHLRAELDREYSPDEIASLERVYVTLGLLPGETDLAGALVTLYGAQVAGFYDPRVRTLFLVDPPPSVEGGWLIALLQLVLRRDLVGEMLLAHELTHALQDQNFDVLGRVSGGGNDDRALAAAAVVEGDATLAGFAYLFGGLPESSLLALVEQLRAIPGAVEATLPEIPAVLRESLVFRYTEGVRFVAWAYLAAGWDGVNAVLAWPPRSSEQVLWPEKYFVEPDDPSEISLGGLDRYRDDPAWELIEENTLGELMIRVLLTEHLDAGRAEWAARGWDGDRFAAWASDGETHVIWMTVWDSVRDAKDFFAAEADVLGAGPPAPVGDAATPPGAPAVVASGNVPHPSCLEQRGHRVLVLLGVARDACAAVAADVWRDTHVTLPEERSPLDLAIGRPPFPAGSRSSGSRPPAAGSEPGT